MKLKGLREHFTTQKQNYGLMKPKRGFKSKEEAEESLGFKPDLLYKCSVCGELHVTSWRLKK